jgi:anti-sigma-K factor RskA
VGVSEHRLEHLDLCAEWALGTLSPDDKRRLEEHLAGGCVECEAALADFSAATVLLGASAPPATPSPRLRERVMAAARASTDGAGRAPAPVPGPWRDVTDASERRGRSAWTTWVPLAAAAALAITTAVLWMQVQRLGGELRADRAKLSESEQQLA